MLADLKLRKIYDGLLFLGESARNPPKIASHHHIELEMNLIVQGTVTYVVNERRFTYRPRTLLWLFPKQEHQIVDRSDDAKFFVAVFKPSLIARCCRTNAYRGLRRPNNERDGVLNVLLEPASFDLIRKTMDSLMRGSLDPDVLNQEGGFGVESKFSFEHGDPEGLNAGLHHLLLLCWRSMRSGQVLGDGEALHPVVQRALNVLSEPECDHNLGELARICGASPAHLSRTFRRQIGIPLNRYRNSVRLSRFMEQYRKSGQKNLSEAVYASGFGSYAQFYKVFTQAYGCGPRACLARFRSPIQ